MPWGTWSSTTSPTPCPGGWTLFEGVTFRVPEGAHAALIGANGIGKTTLLRLIAGELEPTGGLDPRRTGGSG